MSTHASTQFVDAVRERAGKAAVGKDAVVERVMIALFTGGRLLLQGMHGLAKTLLVNCLARAIDLKFSQAQFTIDLLPLENAGSEILDQANGRFRTHQGPVFTKLLTHAQSAAA